MRFSTYDRDNDNNPGDCAGHNKGGWWYNGCQYSHLNGPYFNATQGPQIDGIRWLTREVLSNNAF